jgi:hypothetical protein
MRRVAFVIVLAIGCSRSPAPVSVTDGGSARPPMVVGAELHQPLPHKPSFDGGPIEFVQETFAQLYPIFCVRRSMPLGEKSALWQRKYYGRWVRWTGKVMSFTANGLTLKTGWQTVTFDISLWLEGDQMPLLRQLHLKKGDRVTFIGRLDSYDDIFQKLYLTHGAVLSEIDPTAPDTTHIPDGGY